MMMTGREESSSPIVHHSVTPPQAQYRRDGSWPSAETNGIVDEALPGASHASAHKAARASPRQRSAESPVQRSSCFGCCLRPCVSSSSPRASPPPSGGEGTKKHPPDIGPGRVVYPNSTNGSWKGEQGEPNDANAQGQAVKLSPEHVVSPVPNVKRYVFTT
jgi:hypothetical protein